MGGKYETGATCLIVRPAGLSGHFCTLLSVEAVLGGPSPTIPIHGKCLGYPDMGVLGFSLDGGRRAFPAGPVWLVELHQLRLPTVLRVEARVSGWFGQARLRDIKRVEADLSLTVLPQSFLLPLNDPDVEREEEAPVPAITFQFPV